MLPHVSVVLADFLATVCTDATSAVDCDIAAHTGAVCELRNSELSDPAVDPVVTNELFFCRCRDNFVFDDLDDGDVTTGTCGE